jgi:phosphoglycolate phosphatase
VDAYHVFCLLKKRGSFGQLERTIQVVAEIHDHVDSALADVAEHGFQRPNVPVDVGDRSDSSNGAIHGYTGNVMIRVLRPIPQARIKLLIFDLDGTLVDSQLDLAYAVNAMLRHFNKPELPVHVISGYIGDGAPMLVRRALNDPQDEHFFNDAMDFFIRYYREHKLDNTYVYAGMKEALDSIRQASDGRIKMAVLSNKPVRPSEGIIAGLGLSEYFVAVYGGNSFATKKPDPEGARKLLEVTGTNPDEAIMVGDSHNDTLTARNAGLWSIGCTYGLAPHSLENAPPDVYIDAPYELVDALRLNSGHRSSEVPASEGFSG